MPLLLLLFALHTFLLMGTGTWSDLSMAGEDFGPTLYYVREGVLAAGFLLYAAFAQWKKARALPSRATNIAAIILAALFVSCTVILQVSVQSAACVPAVLVIAVLVGFSGGMVYEHIALAAFQLACDPGKGEGAAPSARHNDPARVLGVVVGGGGAIAVVLQYALQTGFSVGPELLAVCFIACFALIMWLARKARPAVADDHEGEKPCADVPSGPKVAAGGLNVLTFACMIVAVICLCALFLFYEAAVRSTDAVTSFYEWHRLFLAVGYIVIGAAAYLGGRPAASVAVLVSALFAIVVSVQMAMSEAGPLTAVLFYALLAAVLAWSAIAFMSIAAQSSCSALVASTWRILIELVTLSEVLILAAGDLSLMAVLITSLILLAIVVVAMVKGGFVVFSGRNAESYELLQGKDALPPEAHAQLLASECGLTGRERDVLMALVLTENKNQQIADDLGISRRQLQNHISRIYEKTGTTTRAGLVMRVNEGE